MRQTLACLFAPGSRTLNQRCLLGVGVLVLRLVCLVWAVILVTLALLAVLVFPWVVVVVVGGHVVALVVVEVAEKE